MYVSCLRLLIDSAYRRTQQITDALRQKRKEIAMTYLRGRKQLEEVLKKRLGSLELLQSTLLRVETSAGDIEVCFDVYTPGAPSMLIYGLPVDYEIIRVINRNPPRDPRAPPVAA